MPQCITRSALDKNLNAKATSRKASTFLTVSSQPPDFGSDFNQSGNTANKPKGNPSAIPKPASPNVKGHTPPLNEPTSSEPKIGPVQEKETRARVSDIKKIPPILAIPPFSSALLAREPGKVISKKPKKESAKTIKTIKNRMFRYALVDIVLKISGFTLPTI